SILVRRHVRRERSRPGLGDVADQLRRRDRPEDVLLEVVLPPERHPVVRADELRLVRVRGETPQSRSARQSGVLDPRERDDGVAGRGEAGPAERRVLDKRPTGSLPALLVHPTRRGEHDGGGRGGKVQDVDRALGGEGCALEAQSVQLEQPGGGGHLGGVRRRDDVTRDAVEPLPQVRGGHLRRDSLLQDGAHGDESRSPVGYASASTLCRAGRVRRSPEGRRPDEDTGVRGCGNPASGFYGAAMRLGVLDIGSNTVHLLVVDAAPGARPLPAVDARSVVRLMPYVDSDGAGTDRGVAALTTSVRKAVKAAAQHDVDELIGLATSALREAVNGQDVLARLSETAGAPLQVLSGPAEAELTFLAARRWHGWAAGRLLVLDIGGGSFEVALGLDETPEY